MPDESTASGVRGKIRDALARLNEVDFKAGVCELLKVLGYESDRTDELSGDVKEFLREYDTGKERRDTKSAREFCAHAKSAHIIFQLTGEEIDQGPQQSLGLESEPSFNTGLHDSFLFIAVELNEGSYSRGDYAGFTQEINKRFLQPAVVLFKTTSGLLTLAFVHHRQHKRNPDRDVLGSVSLVREVNPGDPHRAHVDILAELSLRERLKWMADYGKVQNFDGLLQAWLDALDTEALSRRFFRELLAWYQRAISVARFPTGQEKNVPPQMHVIRLITRLLFTWFIKEKDLVAEELFIEEQAKGLLKDYDPQNGDSYYRAILQNLFFATLNTEIDNRRFSKKSNTTHRDFFCYRYKGEMAEPGRLLELFNRTPFINGGLFDCLDSYEGYKEGGYRIDCFSDNPKHSKELLSIPNHLFFNEDKGENKGLIPLLNRYKFTVEENTPIEQEVALDPELLGQVFESLLAGYNVEIGGHAIVQQDHRKKTGAYYTPRPVVDYMVDEALAEALAERVSPDDGDKGALRKNLDCLLDYKYAKDTRGLFTAKEIRGLVHAIAELKVLDPAVGSGAFPMGILHKLTLALRRLDPDNKLWEKLQKKQAKERAANAFETKNQDDREAELGEISKIFEQYRDSDFGRKLYLIQNSIYGLDIEPIACQIAKLRFFISLAIEQETNNSGDNYGIKPLPNLETRFIATDTLLDLPTGEGEGLSLIGSKAQGQERKSRAVLQQFLTSPKAQKLEEDIHVNRQRYFHASDRRKKRKCIRQDKQLRTDLAAELRQIGMPADVAQKIAQWDPYDQNAKADWFDKGHMFGVDGGFDIVIGNPPYIQLQKNGGELRKRYKPAGYKTFTGTGDIYQLFYERGCQLLKTGSGLLAFITSNSWLRAKYGKTTREYFTGGHSPLRLLEMGADVFASASVDTAILILRHGRSTEIGKAADMNRIADQEVPPTDEHWVDFQSTGGEQWFVLSKVEKSVMEKMEQVGTPLKEWDVSINMGIKTGYSDAFIIDADTKDELVSQDPSSEQIIKPVLRGRDIDRYRYRWAGLWLIDTHNGYDGAEAVDIDDYPVVKEHLDGFYPVLADRLDKGRTPYNLRSCAYREDFAGEKLFWMDMSGKGRFAYSKTEMYCRNDGYMITGGPIKYLCAVLNSGLVHYFMGRVAPTLGDHAFRWFKSVVETIPIPEVSAAERLPFIRLVDKILKAKAADPDADISALEARIDELVYQLYGLTEKEIEAIEAATDKS